MAETLELQQVICPSCKQVITSFSPFQAEVECPYCHNKAFNPLITAKKVPVPERIIAFTTTQDDFEKKFVDKLVDSDYVPKDIFQCINPGNVIKAYLPMYLYEGTYQSSWTCKVATDVEEVQNTNNGAKARTVKKYTPHTGTSQGNFSFLCLAYEGKDIPEELRAFCSHFPYNVMASKEYDPALLGIGGDESPITLAVDADTDLVWNKYGNDLVNDLARKTAMKQLSGDMIRDFRASNSYDLKHSGRYILAPFWFVYYTYNNEKHYFIMDGLGDKTSMTTPVDAQEKSFVDSRNLIKTIATCLCLIAFLLMFLVNVKTGLIYLAGWVVVKIIVNMIVNRNVQAHLDASRAERRAAAAVCHAS